MLLAKQMNQKYLKIMPALVKVSLSKRLMNCIIFSVFPISKMPVTLLFLLVINASMKSLVEEDLSDDKNLVAAAISNKKPEGLCTRIANNSSCLAVAYV